MPTKRYAQTISFDALDSAAELKRALFAEHVERPALETIAAHLTTVTEHLRGELSREIEERLYAEQRADEAEKLVEQYKKNVAERLHCQMEEVARPLFIARGPRTDAPRCLVRRPPQDAAPADQEMRKKTQASHLSELRALLASNGAQVDEQDFPTMAKVVRATAYLLDVAGAADRLADAAEWASSHPNDVNGWTDLDRCVALYRAVISMFETA